MSQPNSEGRCWKPGDHVVLRGVLNGRVLSAQPHVVVRDTPELIALWLPPGAVWMKPTGREDAVRKRLNGDWTLFRDIWNGEGMLRLTEPGRPYSVLILWTPGMSAVRGWYINIEDPFRRTGLGFDYLDQLLDVVVAADRQSWRWKDEDEFEEAIELGVIEGDRAAELRAAAGEAVLRIQQRQPPYTDDWIGWRPEPGWTVPRLPPGWENVDDRPKEDAVGLPLRTSMHQTPDSNVNALLEKLLLEIQRTLDRNLVGVYLYGSLTTGDFDSEASDIDLLAVASAEIDEAEFDELRAMHMDLARDRPEWKDRIEVAYVSVDALRTFRTKRSAIAVISPGEPFHRRDRGAGKDWLQNWYVVREFGVALFGPPANAIIPPITRREFAQAVRDYAVTWVGWLDNAPSRNNQAYAILTMCRALYVHRHESQVSKKQAATWARSELPQWSQLIQNALLWRSAWREEQVDHGATSAETMKFLHHVRGLLDQES